MKRASSSKDQKLLKILQEMESLQVPYPEELRAARRTSFLEQVEQATVVNPEEQPSVQDRMVVDRLRSLRSVPVEYPSRLLVARKSAFVRRIAWLNFVSLCTAVGQGIRQRVSAFYERIPVPRVLSPSLLAASLALAAFAGYLFYENQGSVSRLQPPRYGTVQSGRIITTDAREVRIICKPGAQPPLCLAGEYKKDDGLAVQGNGSARPAVAKDTMPADGNLHKAAYINDGLYGPGASWISNSRNSWIKIDLGKATEINTVTFGRDRLGKLSGHNPGQFVVALAVSDNVYADGNNSNDDKEYQPVFNSEQAGFSGTISGPETVVAQFEPKKARYIKITFENKGTAVDEVEAFMAQPPVASSLPGTASQDKPSTKPPTSQSLSTTISPITVTSLPVNTATSIPTATLVPSETATPMPTATEIPTNTPIPTSTEIPTSTPVPTNTPTDVPSDTPLPPPASLPPTSTPVPPDTETPATTELTPPAGVSPKIDLLDSLTGVPLAAP